MKFLTTIAACFLVGIALSAAGQENPGMTMGNGDANWIILEGASRDGSTFTFREVQIDGNGWLVMHPFVDGRSAELNDRRGPPTI